MCCITVYQSNIPVFHAWRTTQTPANRAPRIVLSFFLFLSLSLSLDLPAPIRVPLYRNDVRFYILYIEKKLSYKFEKYFKNETKKLTSTKEQQQLQQLPLTVLQLFPLQLFPLSLNICMYIELRVFLNALFPFFFFFIWWFPWGGGGVTCSLQGGGEGSYLQVKWRCVFAT